MKVMVIVKATKSSEAGEMPSEKLLTEMGAYNEQLVKAGMMLDGAGLHPSSKGARVRFSGESRSVVDGPFAETKELIAGYWIWQVKSLDEAIEWVKRCPNPMPEESEIEIRPLFSAEDFGPEFTPELRAQEERQMQAIMQQTFKPRFEQGPELLIAGHNATYTYETRSQIPAQWCSFAKHIGHIPGQVGRTTYGVCWNCQSGVGFDYLCGVEVQDTPRLPEGFTHVHLPAQRYAVFTHEGHVSALPATIDSIWQKWPPNSGYKAAKAPCFERYTEAFNPETGLGGMEIWVPLEA